MGESGDQDLTLINFYNIPMNLESVNYFSEIETQAALGHLPREHNNSGLEPKSEIYVVAENVYFLKTFFQKFHFQGKKKPFRKLYFKCIKTAKCLCLFKFEV